MIAIDPGAQGGIVFDGRDGVIHVRAMPATPGDIIELLTEAKLAQPGPAVCVIEDVGHYMPGNSGPASVTFAAHCGGLEWALIALGICQERVTPQKWQRTLGALPKASPKATAGEKAKAKSARKNAIKALMQQRYPNLKITLGTADALALYDYAIRQGLARAAA